MNLTLQIVWILFTQVLRYPKLYSIGFLLYWGGGGNLRYRDLKTWTKKTIKTIFIVWYLHTLTHTNCIPKQPATHNSSRVHFTLSKRIFTAIWRNAIDGKDRESWCSPVSPRGGSLVWIMDNNNCYRAVLGKRSLKLYEMCRFKKLDIRESIPSCDSNWEKKSSLISIWQCQRQKHHIPELLLYQRATCTGWAWWSKFCCF